MAKRNRSKKSGVKLARSGEILFRKTATGAEEWEIWSDSGRVRVVTSAASTATMDEATKTYAGALKRLAKR